MFETTDFQLCKNIYCSFVVYNCMSKNYVPVMFEYHLLVAIVSVLPTSLELLTTLTNVWEKRGLLYSAQ